MVQPNMGAGLAKGELGAPQSLAVCWRSRRSCRQSHLAPRLLCNRRQRTKQHEAVGADEVQAAAAGLGGEQEGELGLGGVVEVLDLRARWRTGADGDVEGEEEEGGVAEDFGLRTPCPAGRASRVDGGGPS